jgi:ribonucleoside-diphosphate reductase beta chain
MSAIVQNTLTQNSTETYEKLLHDSARRFILFPILYHDVWTFYNKIEASHWTPQEIDMSRDLVAFERLQDGEKQWIKMVLGFFASADTLVNLNIMSNLQQEVVVPEALAFYAVQAHQETVHNIVYSQLIETLVTDEHEKMHLFNALETIPAIRRKGEWTLKWCDARVNTFQTRLVAFACVEGLLFASSFAAIAYLKHRKLGLDGVCVANEFISRDESLHCDFACHLYREHVQNKLEETAVHEIIRAAVEIEDDFVTDAVPVALIGMSASTLQQYVRFCADRLCTSLGVSTMYNASNPFQWIALLSVPGSTSFFEKRVSDYQKSSISTADITFDDAF